MDQRLTRRNLLAGGVSLATASLAGRSFETPAYAGPQPQRMRVAKADADALTAYFHGHARELLRPAAGMLTFPSISPSLPRATYSSDLWDWDTLWTARGLFRLAEVTDDKALHTELAAHVRGSLENFFAHQAPDGRIPMLITVTDADPLGCLRGSGPQTGPRKENQAKPVLAQLALLIAEQTGDVGWFGEYMPKLVTFHESWRANNLSPTGLLVWGDDVAIGNDNDPTTFGRPFFSSANLLLNCLYYQDLQAAARLAEKLGRNEDHELYAKRAADLASAIQQHCWDKRDRFFYTADVQCVDRRSELIPNVKRGMDMSWSSLPLRIQTFTGFLPLWCGITTPEQNAALARHFADQNGLGAPYGVRTLSAAEPMYSLAASSNPSNWLGPVWIIANYLVWKGFAQQGMKTQADAIAASTVTMLARDLAHSGSLNEYYHPDTGGPLSHKGFVDWNLLVLEMM